MNHVMSWHDMTCHQLPYICQNPVVSTTPRWDHIAAGLKPPHFAGSLPHCPWLRGRGQWKGTTTCATCAPMSTTSMSYQSRFFSNILKSETQPHRCRSPGRATATLLWIYFPMDFSCVKTICWFLKRETPGQVHDSIPKVGVQFQRTGFVWAGGFSRERKEIKARAK